MTAAQGRAGTPAGTSTTAAGPADAQRPHAVDPWPRGISRRASMRISDVLAALQIEFPAVTNSKLRFLEEQGLVEPVRTQAGYRQYSPADVERLRFVLRQQRDRYLPLKVIGDQLAALDAGDEDEAPAPRLATHDGVRQGPILAGRYTVETLAAETGVAEHVVAELVEAGVLRPTSRGQLGPQARDVVVLAAALREHGIDARHLRTFRAAAERQVDVVEQVVAPWRGQHTASSRARAATVAAEVGELCGQLHTALVRAGVADLAP